MATIREELHALIDELSDEDAEHWLIQLQSSNDVNGSQNDDWHEQMRRIRERIATNYGETPSVVDILNEVREERLNDLMDGE